MKTKSSIVLAVLLIAAAVVIILSSFGLVPAQVSRLILSWQMIFVVIAIVSLFKKHFVNAGVFLILAAYFVLPLISNVYGWKMPLAHRDLNGVFVASLVIMVALGILFGTKRVCHKMEHKRKNKFFI